MLAVLIPQGFLFVGSILLLSRWVDVRTLRVVCLLSLLTELIGVVASTSFISATQSSQYLLVCSSIFNPCSLNSPIILMFDEVSGFFFCVLLTALILCFAFLSSYFEYDTAGTSIMSLSSIFSQLAFMFFCAADTLSLLALWEWISIVSFFLVQHWSMRVTSLKASLKVFVISQLGDLGFVFGLVLINITFDTTDLAAILVSAQQLSPTFVSLSGGVLIDITSVISLTALTALFLKSAQFIFYPWLLDAMEAPVPISAQLHSSTLVVIGFYVFLRLLPIVELWQYSSSILVLIGASTAIAASVLGFRQEDGKRLLACSTAGQLGYVVIGLGLGAFDEALVLLVFCCCNKAYTFVWFGSIMERCSGFSDFRVLGGVSVTLVEKVGLLSAVANSTIGPGAFAWHVKSLLTRGSLSLDSTFMWLGVEVLALTWALSSAYLWRLLLAVFASPKRSLLVRNNGISEFSVVGLYGNSYNFRPLTTLVTLLQLWLMLTLMPFGAFWVFAHGPLSSISDVAITLAS